MSIDYNGVGGIGIKVEDYVDCFIESKLFTQEEWDDDRYDCVEQIGIPFNSAGNHFCDDVYYYLQVEGSNLVEINKNALSFIKKLEKYGIFLKLEDLEVISDICIW